MIGAAAIAGGVILVVMLRSGGEGAARRERDASPVFNQMARRASKPSTKPGSDQAGKQPGRPAPSISDQTFRQLDAILADAKTHYNEGVRRRREGDNRGARAAQAKAKIKLDEWEELIQQQLNWQEEADMEDWAQPAEYTILTRKYATFARLQKSVRMGGGK